MADQSERHHVCGLALVEPSRKALSGMGLTQLEAQQMVECRPVGEGPRERGVKRLAGAGKRTALGSIKVASGSCSWTDAFLVCAAGKEVRVWRFAA